MSRKRNGWGGGVVARVGVRAVGAGVPGLAREHRPVRKRGPEVVPRDDGRGQADELPPRVLPDDAGAGELLPPRLGLPVVHDEVAEAKPPRRAEVEHHRVEAAVEDDRGVAEWAERHRDRGAAQLVVRDLVPDEDLERVGARLAAQLDRDDRLVRVEPFAGLLRRGVPGDVDGRDPVPRGAAGHDLREVHGPLLEIGLRKLPGRHLLPARRCREGGQQDRGDEGVRGRAGGRRAVPSSSGRGLDRLPSDVHPRSPSRSHAMCLRGHGGWRRLAGRGRDLSPRPPRCDGAQRRGPSAARLRRRAGREAPRVPAPGPPARRRSRRTGGAGCGARMRARHASRRRTRCAAPRRRPRSPRTG